MWQAHGYSGQGSEELIDTLPGVPAIVVGSARGVFAEVAAAESTVGGLIFAVNDVSVFLPHVDHVVSLHTPRLVHWVELRRDPTGAGYGNTDFRVHDAGLYGERDWHQWHGLTPLMSQSGLFAAQIAFLMGCRPIVLAGCPADDTPRFWETERKGAGYYKQTQQMFLAEIKRNAELDLALFSMSGWTKELLGGLEDIAA